MTQPQQQQPPIRKRIVPIAVEQPAAVSNSLIGAELPLDVGPAPDQGDVRAVHPTLGPGRRVWASIQDSWEVKFKQVLRQQGLDYNTWKHEQDQHYSTFHKDLHGEATSNKNRPNLITGVLQRVQGMYQPDESEDAESENDKEGSDEEGDGDEDEGDDGSSDDAEDGAAAGDEIDLDKEAEADATRKKAKRQRFERYEDDFIDDSEIEKVKGGPKVKTVYSGFYINRGSVEVVEQASKPKRKPPKPPAGAAAAGAAAGAAAVGKPPLKRRKQQEQPTASQQQQQQPLQHPGAVKGRKKTKQADTAGDGGEPADAAGKKKRGRSETVGAAAADSQAAAPASKKARKASPAGRDAAPPAAAAAPPAVAGAADNGAPGKSVAAAALAAAMAAAAARKAPQAGGPVRGSLPSGRTAGKPGTSAVEAAAGEETAGQAPQTSLQAAATAAAGSQQHQQQQPPVQRRIAPVQVATGATAAGASPVAGAASAAAMAAAFPSSGAAADSAETGRTAGPAEAGAGEEQAAVGQSAPAGLPEQVVSAANALQEAVKQNEAAVSGPAATSATRNKVLAAPLLALGLAFVRLTEPEQQQHTPQLLALVGPLLPHLTDKVLRKKLLQEPRDKLQSLHDHRDTLLHALGGSGSAKGPAAAAAAGGAGGGAGDGTVSEDDFQQAWTHEAEDALVAAWTSAKAVGGQEGLQQLAVDVCAALGTNSTQDQPDKAVAELQQVVNRAKRRQKAARDESKAAAAAAAAAAEEQQQQQQQEQTVEADAGHAAGTQQQPAGAVAQSPARQASPAVAAPAAAATVPAPDQADAAGPTHSSRRGPRGSQDSDTATEGAAADQGHAEAAAPTATDLASQHPKMEFSQWSVPSPRLEGCIAAAKQAGAPEEWLKERYQSIRKGSIHGHQAFRVLCHAGPAGCAIKDFKTVSEAAGLGLPLEEGGKSLKQSLSGKGMSNIVGITEADHNKFALLAFPGVMTRPPKAPRATTPAQSAQTEGQAAGADGAAAAVPSVAPTAE